MLLFFSCQHLQSRVFLPDVRAEVGSVTVIFWELSQS